MAALLTNASSRDSIPSVTPDEEAGVSLRGRLLQYPKSTHPSQVNQVNFRCRYDDGELLQPAPVATRQQSASSDRIKRPRIQVVTTEPVVEQIEALAKQRGMSVSATAAWILERYFDQPDTTGETVAKPDRTDYTEMMRVIKAMKDSGLL